MSEAPRYPKPGRLVHDVTLIIDDVNRMRYTLPLRAPDMVGGVGIFVTRYADDARTIADLVEKNDIRQFKVERRDGAIILLVGNMVDRLLTIGGPRDEKGVTYRDFYGKLITVIANNAKDRQDFEITITSVPVATSE